MNKKIFIFLAYNLNFSVTMQENETNLNITEYLLFLHRNTINNDKVKLIVAFEP